MDVSKQWGCTLKNELLPRNFGQSLKGHLKNVLTPVNLTGVIVPTGKSPSGGRKSEFALVGPRGLEYFFVTDAQWKNVLAQYSWDHVQVIGLLNVANMDLIPQKIYPKGPQRTLENVAHLAAWKGRALVKKLAKNINDLVVIPAAIWALMAI